MKLFHKFLQTKVKIKDGDAFVAHINNLQDSQASNSHKRVYIAMKVIPLYRAFVSSKTHFNAFSYRTINFRNKRSPGKRLMLGSMRSQVEQIAGFYFTGGF